MNAAGEVEEGEDWRTECIGELPIETLMDQSA